MNCLRSGRTLKSQQSPCSGCKVILSTDLHRNVHIYITYMWKGMSAEEKKLLVLYQVRPDEYLPRS